MNEGTVDFCSSSSNNSGSNNLQCKRPTIVHQANPFYAAQYSEMFEDVGIDNKMHITNDFRKDIINHDMSGVKQDSYKNTVQRDGNPYASSTVSAIVSPQKEIKPNHNEQCKYSSGMKSRGLKQIDSYTRNKLKAKVPREINVPSCADDESDISDGYSESFSQELLPTKNCSRIVKELGKCTQDKLKKTKDVTMQDPRTPKKQRIFRNPLRSLLHMTVTRDNVFLSEKAVMLENVDACRKSNNLLAERIKKFVQDVDIEKAKMKIKHPGLTYTDDNFIQALVDMREQIMVVGQRVDVMSVEALREHFRPVEDINVAKWLHNFMQNKQRKYKLISKSNNLNECKYFIHTAWWAM